MGTDSDTPVWRQPRFAQSQSSAPSRDGTARRLDSRAAWLGAAVLIFAASTWVAFTQEPRPNPFAPVRTLSPDWWRYPVEHNAFKRLPEIGNDLAGLHVSADGRRIWAVGDALVIVRSTDGGRTWLRRSTFFMSMGSK